MEMKVAKMCKNCTFAHFNGAQRVGVCTFNANGLHPPDEKNLLNSLKSHYHRTGEIMSIDDLLGDVTHTGWINNRIADRERFIKWVDWHKEFDDVAHRINAGNVCDEWTENKRASSNLRKLAKEFNRGNNGKDRG